jgi:2-polyprenyl-6-methoxyphenol hydroxylase-like FAD-dependent oxidoreductase
MKNIGIIGSGTAGLHLGLRLQAQGLPVTLYAERTPEQARLTRMPGTVAHHPPTLARERTLGVNHWSSEECGVHSIHLHVNGPQPLAFRGWMDTPSHFVDYRIYQPRLAEDFIARGGRLVVRTVQADQVSQLAREHDLLVVASGRYPLADNLFPRMPELSPYVRPPRKVFVALCKGIHYPEPRGMQINLSPGHGEVICAPIFSTRGRLGGLLIEAIPGGALEELTSQRYDDDPRAFKALLLELVREHGPATYEHIDPKEFDVAGPMDWLQGGFTPVVRRGYLPLEGGRFAVAVGDARVLMDPVAGQGANAASAAAWALGDLILEVAQAGGPFDEAFCRRAEERTWGASAAATYWTHALLEAPPPHVIQAMIAAAQNQAIANAFINTFLTPERALATFANPESTAAFLAKEGGKEGGTDASMARSA